MSGEQLMRAALAEARADCTKGLAHDRLDRLLDNDHDLRLYRYLGIGLELMLGLMRGKPWSDL
jgi:ribosomal protein S18 acetylase RimI-like enzyme